MFLSHRSHIWYSLACLALIDRDTETAAAQVLYTLLYRGSTLCNRSSFYTLYYKGLTYIQKLNFFFSNSWQLYTCYYVVEKVKHKFRRCAKQLYTSSANLNWNTGRSILFLNFPPHIIAVSITPTIQQKLEYIIRETYTRSHAHTLYRPAERSATAIFPISPGADGASKLERARAITLNMPLLLFFKESAFFQTLLALLRKLAAIYIYTNV